MGEATRSTRRAVLTGIAAMAGVPIGMALPAASHASGRVLLADTLDGLQKAIDRASPGTRVVLAAGSYTASRPVTITGKTRITVAAERVGAVTISGPAGFILDNSSYAVIEGFRFTGSATTRVPVNCPYARITRNHFELTAGDGAHWLNIDGDDATVDHNTFARKSNLGVYLSIVGPADEVAKRTHVYRNYFLEHSFTGSNGGEPIRLGLSSRQRYSAHATVEYNLFDRVNGDPEAISVKSSDNLIRYNTIIDSAGGIVLRHGNRTRVEGNILRGGSTGIRFYGNDHVVVNNQVAESSGRALTIGSGSVVDDTSSTGNDRPDRVLVAFNTFVHNATSVSGEGNRPLEPHDCVIANNIVQGGGSQLVTMPIGEVGFRWEGNILHGAPAGDIPASGYRAVDPQLAEDAYGIFRPAGGSPAVGGAVGSYPMVDRDIDRVGRGASKDAGADEVATSGPGVRPLTPADVGPDAR